MRGGAGDEAVPSPKGYIACYILDPTPKKQAYMDAVSRMSGLSCINISREGGNPESLQRSVEEWLSLIENADYMLTDSFHGTVFSLIFRVSFIRAQMLWNTSVVFSLRAYIGFTSERLLPL